MTGEAPLLGDHDIPVAAGRAETAATSPQAAAIRHHGGAQDGTSGSRDGVPTVFEINKSGLEIKDAPHSANVDCADSRNVHMTRDLLVNLGNLFDKRLEYLERKAHDEKGDFTELEVLVREVAPKFKAWMEYLDKDGPKPKKTEILTQADLDLAYYLLVDEVEQRGAFLGYETFLQGTARGWHPEVDKFSASSRRGISTPYNEYLFASTRDEEKIVEDLEKWENVRINFEQALSGRGPRDRIFNRANWGFCLNSMFRRDRSELLLHTEILRALEGLEEPVIRRYVQTHGHIQRITDLLVNLDNPADRNVAIRAYHEAISKASAKRFQLKADEILDKNLDRRKGVWQEKGWMETAEENLKALEGEGQLSPEQRKELEELRDRLKGIKDKLRGKSEGADVVMGIPGKLQGLQDAISDYRKYSAEHTLVDLKDRLRDTDIIFRGYEKGRLPAAAADAPEELTRIKTDLDDARVRLTNLKGVPILPALPATPAEIRAQQSTVTELEKAYGEAIGGYRDIAHTVVNELKAEIATIETQLSTKDAKIREQYGFIETEIPDHIVAITDLRNRLDRLAHPPAVGVAVAPPVAAHLIHHVGLLDQQRDHLDRILFYLNGMLDGTPIVAGPPPAAAMPALRMGPNESTEDYVGRYAFNLDRNLFRTIVALPFEEEIRSYEEIMKGVHNAERENKIKAVQLVQHIAGDDHHEGTLGKANARHLAEGQDGKAMAELRNTHNLAVVRDLICNHPQILGAKKGDKSLGLDDTLLWQRVFSDVFILQSYIEWSFRRGGLTIPPRPAAGGVDFNLEAVDDTFRQRIIERMTSNHIDFGQFLNYMVEKRLRDAGEQLTVEATLREAQGVVAATGVITYHDNDHRIGRAAAIFTVENNVEFADRMRTKEYTYYTFPSAEGEIDNIGVVRHSRSGFVHYLNIISPQHDPLVLNIPDVPVGGAAVGLARKRNIPISIHLRTSPTLLGGGRFQILVQADPSLAGLGVDSLGRLDRRWVNLLGLGEQITYRRYDNYADLLVQIGNLLPHTIPANEIGNYILRSLGEYFLELSPTRRLSEFSRFPDQPITAAYPALGAIGFQRISLDSSGHLELVRTTGAHPHIQTTRISIDSALEGRFEVGGVERKLNVEEIEQLLRLVGGHIFNIVRR